MSQSVLPDRRHVRRSFDRAALTYDAAAALQREVCDRVVERLDFIKQVPRRVLDLGCGTGYGTAKLAARYGDARVVALDLAESMLPLALKAGAPEGWAKMSAWFQTPRRHAVCADAEALPLAHASIDLVFSNLTMQWCDPKRLFAEARRVLTPGGLLMFSTFGPDTLKELRSVFATVDALPHVNSFIDMHDLGDELVHAGFADPVMDMEIITVTYADLKALLMELKAIGAHNVLPGRERGLMGRQRWEKLIAEYDKLRKDGRLPSTYEVVYGHAWKPLQDKRKLPDGTQVIDFPPERDKKGMRGSA
jgi:malonyl-CoA O-methyltransferase